MYVFKGFLPAFENVLALQQSILLVSFDVRHESAQAEALTQEDFRCLLRAGARYDPGALPHISLPIV